jgi:hypothetical protein
VARQLAEAADDDITRTARTFALLNMSLSDAHITVFETKYFYNYWRPETGVPRGDEDGNARTDADPTFKPFVPTPCFPSYPSAHGTGGGSSFVVLRRAYGRRGHDLVVTHPATPGIVLEYDDLRDITDDVSDARVYGGIHWRFDQDEGDRQGKKVARHILKDALKRADGGNDDCEEDDDD